VDIRPWRLGSENGERPMGMGVFSGFVDSCLYPGLKSDSKKPPRNLGMLLTIAHPEKVYFG
jgi:hypothetical protein